MHRQAPGIRYAIQVHMDLDLAGAMVKLDTLLGRSKADQPGKRYSRTDCGGRS
jgi:hypothetical protein